MEQPPTRHAQSAVIAQVKSLESSLPPAERRLAELLLADPASFARSPLIELAAKGRTSTTTVLRFYGRLGFERFRDFQLALTEELLRHRIQASDERIAATDIAREDPLDQVVVKIARDEKLSLDETAAVLDVAELSRAVRLVTGAPRVDVFGLGASATVGSDLQQKLNRIGRTTLVWSDPHSAWTAAASLGEGCVAIAITYSGATPETVDFLALARDSGAATIAVTNAPRSPVCEQADVVLLTAARETAFRSGALSSRIAQLMVVDCLFVGVVQASYDESASALRTSYEAVRTRAGRWPASGR